MKSLIAGREYTVETMVPIAHSYGAMQYEHPEGLTNANTPVLRSSDKCWSRFYRGLGRYITVKLDREMAVTGFKVSFLQSRSEGVYTPQSVELHVSQNGVDYTAAYVVESLVNPSDGEAKISEFCLHDAARYKAAYVRLAFETQVNVFACGFEVYGGECDGTELEVSCTPGAASVTPKVSRDDGFASTVIIYHGYWDSTMKYDEHYVKNTVDDLLPYVGYVEKNGKITDTMFDSVAFLLLQSRAPSGGKAVFIGCSDDNVTVKSDFDCFIENLFFPDCNMDALEAAFGIVKEQLGLPCDRKLNVSVQLPFVYKTKLPFGDINGDGAAEGAYTVEERLAIYEYYIDKVSAVFKSKGYRNLSLAAFYQGCESVPFAMSEDEYRLFAVVNEALHKRSYKATWIPSFLGAGFERWHELGFDYVYMQPNYMFHDWQSPCLADFARIVKDSGIGAEIELNYPCVLPDSDVYASSRAKYIDYLDYGAVCGYMNGPLAFYQGAGPGYIYTSAVSSKGEVRELYERTHEFIKGCYTPQNKKLIREYLTMENNEEKIEQTSEEVLENDECACAECEYCGDECDCAEEKVKLSEKAKAAAQKAKQKAGDIKARITCEVKKVPEDKALAAIGVLGAVVALIAQLGSGSKEE